MANYRNISMKFWSDSKVVDEFTPEDRYGFLYILSNEHTNLCGCYELSIRTMAREMGYSEDSVKNLLKRLDSYHDVIKYDAKSKELLIVNWCKYQWSKSDKLNQPLLEEIKKVKCDRFREYLASLYNQRPKIPEAYDPDEVKKQEKPEPPRHKFGEYGWVKLSDDEYERLAHDLGETELCRCIKYIDESAQETGNKNKWKDWNLVLRKCCRERWGLRNGGSNTRQQPEATSNVFLQAGEGGGAF